MVLFSAHLFLAPILIDASALFEFKWPYKDTEYVGKITEEFPNLNIQCVYLYEHQNSTQDESDPGEADARESSGEDEVAIRR